MNIVMETSATDLKQSSPKAHKRSASNAQSVAFGDALSDLVQRERAERIIDMKAERANAVEQATNGSSKNVSDSTADPSEASLRGECLYDADHGASGAELLSAVAPEGNDPDMNNLSHQDELTLSMVEDGYKLSGAQEDDQLPSATMDQQKAKSVVGAHQLGTSPHLLNIAVPNGDPIAPGLKTAGEPLAAPLSDSSAAIFDRLSQDLTGFNSGASDKQRISNLSASTLHTQTSVDLAPHERSQTSATHMAASSAGNGESLMSRSSNALPTVEVSAREPQTFASTMATHLRVIKSQGGGEAKVNLHPAELGRMSVSVITEGNETKVAFTVETSQARQAVEASLPRLREMLEQAGLSLADSNVSEQNRQSGTQDESAFRQYRGLEMDGADDVSEAELSLSVRMDPNRLIDTYV